jgi:tripartite-type tricarboxylate transporter receptor subunit TctC
MSVQRAFCATTREDLMTLPRRTFVRLAASAVAASGVAVPALSRVAWAAADPSRPVRIVVGFAPGSSSDMIARMFGHTLSERTGREFIVDNRPGIGGNLATEAVVNAAPDGLTLLMSGTSDTISATLYQKLSFNFQRDIAPVAALVRSPNVVAVSPSLPVETVGDLIALAKADPGKLRMASAGVGSASHLAGEMFKMVTGTEMTHVAYRGGGADTFADLVAGRADVYFPARASATSFFRSGSLRTLAAPGFDASTWFGIGAPRNTPADIVARLNGEFNAVLADPEIASRIAGFGGSVVTGSPADFGALITEETARWAKVIKASGTTLS